MNPNLLVVRLSYSKTPDGLRECIHVILSVVMNVSHLLFWEYFAVLWVISNLLNVKESQSQHEDFVKNKNTKYRKFA